MSEKRKRSFTLTDTADMLLEVLAEKMGISKTAVLEIAIRDYAQQQGVQLSPGADSERA